MSRSVQRESELLVVYIAVLIIDDDRPTYSVPDVFPPESCCTSRAPALYSLIPCRNLKTTQTIDST